MKEKIFLLSILIILTTICIVPLTLSSDRKGSDLGQIALGENTVIQDKETTSLYYNKKLQLSIEYPARWHVDDSEPSAAVVSFTDTGDMNDYYEIIEIYRFVDPTLTHLQDEKFLESMIENVSTCEESYTFSSDGFLCSNSKLLDSKILEIEGKKAYQVRHSWTQIERDGTTFDNITIDTYIPIGPYIWEVYAETLSDLYHDHQRIFETSINSFKVTQNVSSETMSLYYNKKLQFSIEYPSTWGIDDLPRTDPTESIVSITDTGDPNGYYEIINVFRFVDPTLTHLQDEKFLESMIENVSTCEEYFTFWSGFLCSNFKLLDSKILEIEGKKAYQVRYSWTATYQDQTTFDNVSISTSVRDGVYTWEIFIETSPELYQEHGNLLENSINSFKLNQKEESSTKLTLIPSWIKNNAKWWAEGTLTDNDFVQGVQYLIKENIMKIPETKSVSSKTSQQIPSWIKNNADWWANGKISDDDFIKGIQYLIQQGIMKINS